MYIVHIGRSSTTSGIYLLQPQNPLQLIRLENEEIKIGTGLLTKACLFLSLQSPRTRCVHTPQGGKWGMKFAIYFLCTAALGFLMGNVNEFLLCQNVMLLFLLYVCVCAKKNAIILFFCKVHKHIMGFFNWTGWV